ncbi:hypothetical protein LK08_01915 [Streptomyces sp. MUSC 125]|nr:hypothetical protein LK08_01915 [Streptomyces sp. MUSC 125]
MDRSVFRLLFSTRQFSKPVPCGGIERSERIHSGGCDSGRRRGRSRASARAATATSRPRTAPDGSRAASDAAGRSASGPCPTAGVGALGPSRLFRSGRARPDGRGWSRRSPPPRPPASAIASPPSAVRRRAHFFPLLPARAGSECPPHWFGNRRYGGRRPHWSVGKRDLAQGRFHEFRGDSEANATPGGQYTWESRIHAGLAWRGVSARRHL